MAVVPLLTNMWQESGVTAQCADADMRVCVGPRGTLTFYRRRTDGISPRWGRFPLSALRLVQQPIVPLQAGAAHLSCEVLCRFQSPDGTMLAPAEFIEAAEARGVMPIFDRDVFTSALRHLSTQPMSEGMPRTCLNMSAQTLAERGFVPFVLDQLDYHGVPGYAICLEITETAPIKDVDAAAQAMTALHGRGCHFALDDFGTGFASIDVVTRLPWDYVKISGQFVADRSNANDEVLRFIVALANRLNLPTIAEHVTSHAMLERMRDLGVDYAQGYAIGEIQPFALAS